MNATLIYFCPPRGGPTERTSQISRLRVRVPVWDRFPKACGFESPIWDRFQIALGLRVRVPSAPRFRFCAHSAATCLHPAIWARRPPQQWLLGGVVARL